jgi:hypothetical protein
LPSAKVSTFDNATVGYSMVISSSNGAVYFAPTASDKVANTDVVVGKIVAVNPDDKTVTAYVTPALYA